MSITRLTALTSVLSALVFVPAIGAQTPTETLAAEQQREPPSVWLGITVQEMPDQHTSQEPSRSLRIDAVVEGSPAAAAGLQVGDRLASVDGQPVWDHAGLVDRLRGRSSGERIRLELVRVLEATLEASGESGSDRERGRLGIYPETHRDPARPLIQGEVRVSEVQPDSPSTRAGIRPGDILLSIGDQRLESSEQAHEKIGAHKPGEVVRLKIRRSVEAILAPRPAQMPGRILELQIPRPDLPPSPQPPRGADRSDAARGAAGLAGEIRRLREELGKLQGELAELRAELNRLKRLR